MPVNTEIKARVKNMNALRNIVETLTSDKEILYQEDVFFNTEKGRLKLRFFSEDNGVLIQYERPDTAEPKTSVYYTTETAEPAELRNVLCRALGERIIVKKKREVYIYGTTRIHLDEVEGLGTFMELEVPNKEGSITDLMDKLEIRETDLISGAYADLLEQKRHTILVS